LGTGETLSVPGLPVGPSTIQLEARDTRGLVSAVSVTVAIVP